MCLTTNFSDIHLITHSSVTSYELCNSYLALLTLLTDSCLILYKATFDQEDMIFQHQLYHMCIYGI